MKQDIYYNIAAYGCGVIFNKEKHDVQCFQCKKKIENDFIKYADNRMCLNCFGEKCYDYGKMLEERRKNYAFWSYLENQKGTLERMEGSIYS